MKKFLIACGLLFGILWIYIVIAILFGRYFLISSEIEISVPITAKMDYKDSHGGFHMDGETKAVINFSEKQAQKFIKKIQSNEHWYELPMDELLQRHINKLAEEEMSIPVIQNGYWFVLDRSSMAINEYYYDRIFYRGCENYSVAIFDIDSNTLYYFKEDT